LISYLGPAVNEVNAHDNLGNIGYLGSASLTTDFTNQRVLTSVDLGINEQVWHGQGLQVPIYADATFGGTMAVNVSGSVNANGSGKSGGIIY